MTEFSVPDAVRWRKASHSGLENDCIEIGDGVPGLVPVRDSKEPERPGPVFAAGAWSAFVAGVKAGRFPAPC